MKVVVSFTSFELRKGFSLLQFMCEKKTLQKNTRFPQKIVIQTEEAFWKIISERVDKFSCHD